MKLKPWLLILGSVLAIMIGILMIQPLPNRSVKPIDKLYLATPEQNQAFLAQANKSLSNAVAEDTKSQKDGGSTVSPYGDMFTQASISVSKAEAGKTTFSPKILSGGIDPFNQTFILRVENGSSLSNKVYLVTGDVGTDEKPKNQHTEVLYDV